MRQHSFAEKLRPVADDAAAIPRKTKNNAINTAHRMANDSGFMFHGLRVNWNDCFFSSPQQAIVSWPSCQLVFLSLISLHVSHSLPVSHSLSLSLCLFVSVCDRLLLLRSVKHLGEVALCFALIFFYFFSSSFAITFTRPWLPAEMRV